MAKLSTPEEEDLLYLIHDKGHIGGSGANIPGINAALRHMSSTAATVYRGISRDELAALNKSPSRFVPRGYTSATEDVAVARKFARSYGTNVVLVMEGFKGFCYWRWLVDWFEKLQKDDAEEYESVDGDFMIESAREEKEWLFGRTAYHVESRIKAGPFEFVTVRQGTALSAALASARQLLAKEMFDEKDHPRRADGEFAPKNASSPASTKKTRAHALSTAPEDREKWPDHIKALKLPPAWTSVRYSDDPHADLQAIGKDQKGRDQYVYHEKFAQSQAALKFARIHELDSKFDAISAQVAKARKSKDPATRDVADCVHLIMSTGLRPGGDDDTKAEKKAYGASTLEGRHVIVKKGEVRLRFVGKKGVDVDVPVEDPEAAALLRKRAKEAGADGQLFPRASAPALLDFVHGLDGGSFKTKDMRTLKGTRTARDLVESMDPPKNDREYRKSVMAVAKHVSSVLGNTPSVALAAYISPVVFAEWKTRMHDSNKEEASASDKRLSGVRFGSRGLPDWRGAKKYAGRDDDVPRPTSKSTIRLLGFDPHGKPSKTRETSALSGQPRHHGDVHAELVKLVSAVKRWAYSKLRNDPNYLERRDLDGNLSVITGDHHYSSLMIKLTSDHSPDGNLAVAKNLKSLTYIVMYDCLSSVYEKHQPEFYESPAFTEILAHELTHQLQNLNDADLLIGNRVMRRRDETRHEYINHPRELQAWTMGAVTRFTQHSKQRSVAAFWDWAGKQKMYGSWIEHATPQSLETAKRIVEEVLGGK